MSKKKIDDSTVIALTRRELGNVLAYTDDIIDNLPESALKELMSSFDNDLDYMIENIMSSVHEVIHYNDFSEKKFGGLENFEREFDEGMKRLSYNYFKTTMLPNFDQGWRNLEWGNLIQLYPWLTILAARGHGKCFSPDTEVVMYDGSIKKIQDICVSDKLMGVDGTPRVVLKLHSGIDDMYEIKQNNGLNYTVNSKHDLVLGIKGCCKSFIISTKNAFYSFGFGNKNILGLKSNLNRKKWKVWDDDNYIDIEYVGKGRYYGFTCNKDHLFLLSDRTVVKNSFETSFAFPLWRLWRYNRPNFLQKDTIDNKNSKDTILITNETRLVKLHMEKINEEIRMNDLIRDRLMPDVKSDLGKEKIITKSGSTLAYRTFGSFIRGLHVGAVVVDDFLDESCLYSKEQREKYHEIFYGAIKSIVEPHGYLWVSGCVNPNTYVLTNDGLRQIGDLCPAESYENKKLIPYKNNIMGKDGFSETESYWCNGYGDTYKIETRYGYELEGSDIHPVLIMDNDGLMKWKKMPELKVGDYICLREGVGFGNAKNIDTSTFKSINRVNVNHIKVENELNKDWLYFFGLWIADGSFDKSKNSFTIIKQNKGIRDFVLSGFNNTNFKVRKNDSIKMDFTSTELKLLFDLIGCKITTAKYKEIPKKIIESNENSLKCFLQGVFDGDGCFYSNEGQKSVSIGSISLNLIKQIQLALLNFGICSSISNRGIGISEKVIGKNNLYFLNVSGYDVDLFMDKIGFKYSNKGNKSFSKSKIENSSFRKIPYQSEIFKNIRKEKRRINRNKKIGKLTNSQSLYSKTASKKILQENLMFFINNGAEGKYTEIAKKNLFNDFLFLPIKNISKSKGYTVDFVIPNGHTFISNGIISHNTPFHESDLYQELKEDSMFKVFEYPAVFPSGDLLAVDRFNYKMLMALKQSLGSIVFTREYLVTPVSDSSSLFPWEFLNKSFMGMENIGFTENIEDFPIKMSRVILGCDFAISGKIGADFSAFTVWGKDTQGNYYLMHVWRKQGASHNEQVDMICRLNQTFKCNKIVAEDNGFQRIIIDLVKERGVKNIEPFTTTSKIKKDSYEGLPSLSAMFERGEIKIPYKEGTSRDMANMICGEFNSITYLEDTSKLESAGQHDDTVMSSFFAITDLREKKNGFKVSYI